MKYRLLLSFALITLTIFSCKKERSNSVKIEQKDLKSVLQRVWQSEQVPIRKRDSLMKIYGVDSDQVKEQQNIYENNHTENQKIVTEYLDTYSWPEKTQVGEQGILTICNVIQHSSLEIRSKYLPMMKQAVRDKQLAPRLLARAEDRLATDKNLLQIYGTQIKYYPDIKSFNVWPIKNPEKVDSLRAEIGLQPIAEFLASRRFSIDWNIEDQIERTLTFKEQKLENQAAIYPEDNWLKYQNPNDIGWSQNGFDDYTRFLKDSTSISGLVMIHKGQIIYEYGNLKENSYIASCRKSVLAMLYGKYVDNGIINLEKTLGEMNINDVTELLPIEKKATIKNLISARSGVYLNGSNGGDFRRFAPQRGSVKPGSHWLYSNWDFNLAGFVFEQEANTSIYDEVETQLAIPLGMQDWDKSLQKRSGNKEISKFQAYHMWFSTRDMARIGLLMLNKGKWKDKQLISENWINEMTQQRTSHQEAQKSVPLLKKDGLDLGYGYMWWLIENTNDWRFKGAYSAQGAMGQSITVYPEIDVVLAFKTTSDPNRKNTIPIQMEIIKRAAKMYNK